jgi:4-hydroxybenzoate polyprenyltransferase
MLLFDKLKTLNHSPAYRQLIERLELYAQLVRLDRPIGIYLLLWPTLWSLWIAARGWPDALVLFVFVAGVVLMRSAGCAINDYADRDIDPHVERTRNRPLAAGKVSARETLAVFALLSISAFLLVLLMNRLTIYMSFVGILLAASYPFMKRYHYMPQIHLGAAFGWAAPMAFTAQANEITSVTWLLFMATILWATAYDTMYAMADREDDLKIGVKSTAILFGEADRLIIGILQTLLIVDLIFIGRQSELGLFYYLGLSVAGGLAVYHQWLIRHRDPARCFKAFLHNNWFGMAVFAGIFIDYWVD